MRLNFPRCRRRRAARKRKFAANAGVFLQGGGDYLVDEVLIINLKTVKVPLMIRTADIFKSGNKSPECVSFRLKANEMRKKIQQAKIKKFN